MKAMQVVGPVQMTVVDLSRPAVGPGRGRVRVRVHAAGVCGTDLSLIAGRLPFARYPIVPGHELGGVISEVPPNSPFQVGQRVEDKGMQRFSLRGRVALVCGAQHGAIHILFNVAGMNIRHPIGEVSEEEYDRIMAVNLRGAYFLTKAVGAVMMRQGGGKVVNIASLTSAVGLSHVTVYTATKGALSQFTRGLAVEWGRHNIQVNAIAPGFIVTDLNRKLWEDERMYAWVTGLTPAGRLGRPEDLVGAAVFLASPASDFITGQVLFVDGGFIAGHPWPL